MTQRTATGKTRRRAAPLLLALACLLASLAAKKRSIFPAWPEPGPDYLGNSVDFVIKCAAWCCILPGLLAPLAVVLVIYIIHATKQRAAARQAKQPAKANEQVPPQGPAEARLRRPPPDRGPQPPSPG